MLDIFLDHARFPLNCNLNYVVELLQLSSLQPRDFVRGTTNEARYFLFLSLADYPYFVSNGPFCNPLLFIRAGGGVLRNSIQSPGRKLQLIRGLGNNGGWAADVDRYRAEYREPREKSRTSQQQHEQRKKKGLLAYPREIKEGLLTKGNLYVDRR